MSQYDIELLDLS